MQSEQGPKQVGDTPECVLSGLLQSFPRIGIFRLQFTAEQRIVMPEYSGSAWRGLLGHCLRKAACVTRQTECSGCLLIGTCSYATLFEDSHQTSDSRVRGGYPHPYVLGTPLHDPRVLEPGDTLSFDLTLMGAACAALPYVVHAMQMAGMKGIGKGHGRFCLVRVDQKTGFHSDWKPIYTAGSPLSPAVDIDIDTIISDPPDSPVTVEFLTPLRVKRKGRLIGPREFDFIEDFILPLIWRVNTLAQIHGTENKQLQGFELKDLIHGIEIESHSLSWFDWTRYSSRQNTKMHMGGMIGRVQFQGQALGTLWPLLVLGQWIHVGKATTMGLGHYRLLPPASLPEMT